MTPYRRGPQHKTHERRQDHAEVHHNRICDPAGYDRTPQPVKDAAHAQVAKLRSEGAVIGIAGTPVQVRNPEARGMETLDGPFMSSALPIAGFAIIEATDLADAIAKVAHGVVEVWPLKEAP